MADARTESDEVLGGECLVGDTMFGERDPRVEKSLDFELPLFGERYELEEIVMRVDMLKRHLE